MKRILVLCTGNSCRSQMAEGWLKYFAGDRAVVASAGVEAHGVNPRAVAVMAEAGIDLSSHTSDRVDKYLGREFDYILTVCDNARERCPFFPSTAEKLHYSFPDPATAAGTEEEVLREFRRVRDLIRDFCERFVREKI